MDADDTPLAVLFAQLSGSAVLYEALGPGRALDAVNGSHAGLQAAIEKHDGAVVKIVGDELIARFAGADRALQAAGAMQAFMRTRTDGLAVKVGFTVGPVILENQDIFGDTVNLAARVTAIANPKQVLTTRQAVDLLPPFLRSTCRSLYSTAVKGKAEKIDVFEVMWDLGKSTTAINDPAELEPAPLAQLKLSLRGSTWNMDEARNAVSAGRDPTGDIVLAGDKVSRLHARIFLRHGKFVIADQSANGTFVRMQHHAEIELHREEFVLLGRGSIGLGHSVVEMGEDAIAFEAG